MGVQAALGASRPEQEQTEAVWPPAGPGCLGEWLSFPSDIQLALGVEEIGLTSRGLIMVTEDGNVGKGSSSWGPELEIDPGLPWLSTLSKVTPLPTSCS